MSAGRVSAGRRALRAELESTWSVYDARRPITRSDFAASERAADGAESASAPPGVTPAESAAPSGVACSQCAFARETRRLIAEGARA